MVTSTGTAASIDRKSPYCTALIDWLACACAGVDHRAARAVRAVSDDLLTDVAFVATAGHVLDFDDTFSDGVAHVSAACAPAALMVAADRGLSLRSALTAYAEGFEAMAAVAASNHPALYDGGWHPTAVCGPIGSAVAASRLLGLTDAQRANAVAFALLCAGGTRGSFGSDAKAIQVGLAAAAGVRAALLARGGATINERAIHGALGFEGVFGASWPDLAAKATQAGRATPHAIERNWVKLHPTCLGTHSPIEAAAYAREHGYRLDREEVDVVVHPVARQAAHLDTVNDGLEAKFSIPYCVAHTLRRGPPRVRDFLAVDSEIVEVSTRVKLSLDPSLPEFGAVLCARGRELARIPCPMGSPARPASASELASKVADLAGDRLGGILDELDVPAAAALTAAGLRPPWAAVTA